MNTLVVVLFGLLACAYGHSWVSCTDYNIQSTNDAQVYSPSLCQGFSRGWAAAYCEGTNNAFGVDCGYNYQPGNGAVCKMPLKTNYDSSYSAQSPMATYSPGQRVCLAWPPKNHVAASCANRFIPDHGTKLYMSGPNPTSDPTNLANLRATSTLVKDFGTNTAADQYAGFQNCPKFCQNNDKALCTGCFNLPTNLQTGATYAFYWTWAFNADTDVYTSCWEAKIAPNSGPAEVNQTDTSSSPSSNQTLSQTQATVPQTVVSQSTVPQTMASQSTVPQTTVQQPNSSTTLIIGSVWAIIIAVFLF